MAADDTGLWIGAASGDITRGGACPALGGGGSGLAGFGCVYGAPIGGGVEIMLGWLGNGDATVAGPGVARREVTGGFEKPSGRSFHC